MYQELYRYFILSKELHIPGIGTFSLNNKPASFDFPNRVMKPAAYTINFQKDNGSSSKQFFLWLAQALEVSEREAVIKFNDFVFDFKKQISAGAKLNWKGIGEIHANQNGSIEFTPVENEIIFGETIPAEKVIRDDARHMVRVGEQEKTSVEMVEILSHHPEVKKSNWWAVGLIIILLAVVFTGWYFSTYGLKISSSANQQKIIPAEMPALHKELSP